MENPEEVLQALDEFQRMRSAEIPRELEDYLSWVAKTGDPVYQWSLVKPLFRQKLARVMAEFYESCSSLELERCPNIEQFNYDIMKCNLLEQLESFANAPFTLQRICELLTAPRKEYNRVDKFMRAIEKNILVVSTKEPGVAARRSENGDSMVNGTIDEDTPSTQPSHEVEMEPWVMDCTTDTAVAAPTGENNVPLLESVITASKVSKILASNEECSPVIQAKAETPTAKLDAIDSNVTTTAQNISSPPNLTLPVQSQDPLICGTNVENLSGNGLDSVGIVSDVPEAVINEDTSSQPSLETDAEEGETASSKKLQTTFQTKDFVKVDVKSPKLCEEEVKEDAEKSRVKEKPAIEAETVENSIINEDSPRKSESKLSFSSQENETPIVEGLAEKRARLDTKITDLDTGESPNDEEEHNLPFKKNCSVISESTERSDDSVEGTFLAAPIESKSAEEDKMEDIAKDSTAETTCTERLYADNVATEVEEDDSKESSIDSADNSLPESERTTEISEDQESRTDNPRPIIQEPPSDETSEDSDAKSPQLTTEQEESTVTIEEAMDDDTRINKSIVPDPIPIIEEPKEPEPTLRDTENITLITEIPEYSKNFEETSTVPSPIEATPATIVEETTVGSMIEETANVVQTNEEDITDPRNTPTEVVEPAESMEIDSEESTFQQDEPMEQEPGDLVKS